MFDLTETPERAGPPSFDQFYTHNDGTHWAHSSLFFHDARVNCWFTPDALVVWYPEVFEYDFTTPVSPLLNFPTFAPRSSERSLAEVVGKSWVVSEYASYAGEEPEGYVFVNSWGLPSDCIQHFKLYLLERETLWGRCRFDLRRNLT